MWILYTLCIILLLVIFQIYIGFCWHNSTYCLFTVAMIDRRPLIACVLAVISIAMVTAKGKECGDNPMKQVLLVAKRTGWSFISDARFV